MTLKLATADYSFPMLEWNQAIALASSIGMRGVDISLFGSRSHLNPEEVLSNPSREAAHVSAVVSDHGLEVSDIFGIPSLDFSEKTLNHPDPAEREKSAEYFHRILEFTARCNARHLTLLPGVQFDQESYDDSLKRSSEELAWRLEAARKVGITLSVEAHLGSIVPLPEQAKRLLDMTAELTLTLDYGHFTRQGIPDDMIEPLLPSASHFHARCGRKGRLQAPLKENTIDFMRIVHLLKEQQYKGFVAVEYVWIDWEHCNEVDNLSETILLRDLLQTADKNV